MFDYRSVGHLWFVPWDSIGFPVIFRVIWFNGPVVFLQEYVLPHIVHFSSNRNMHLSERSAPLLSLFEIGNMYFRKLTSWQVEYFTDKLCSTVFIQNIYHPLTHSKKSSRHNIFRGLLSYSSVNAHIHSVVAKSCARWYFCWWFLTLLTLLILTSILFITGLSRDSAHLLVQDFTTTVALGSRTSPSLVHQLHLAWSKWGHILDRCLYLRTIKRWSSILILYI